MSQPQPTSIRLDPELRAFLDARASERGCSRKFLIAEILAKWVSYVKKQKKREKAWQA